MTPEKDISLSAVVLTLLAQAANYPDAGLVNDLISGDFATTITGACEGLNITESAVALRTLRTAYEGRVSDHDTILLDLEREYTRLCFASKPRLVYLFESVYKEGKLLQDSTFQTARIYFEAGLKVDDAFTLPPDHIAVELEAMAYIMVNELEALKTGNRDNHSLARKLAEDLMHNHLKPFALSFADRLGTHGTVPFYRSVASIMTTFFLAQT